MSQDRTISKKKNESALCFNTKVSAMSTTSEFRRVSNVAQYTHTHPQYAKGTESYSVLCAFAADVLCTTVRTERTAKVSVQHVLTFFSFCTIDTLMLLLLLLSRKQTTLSPIGKQKMRESNFCLHRRQQVSSKLWYPPCYF